MCDDHGPFTVPEARFYERVENNEHTDLELAEITGSAEGIHCEYCRHGVVSYEPLFYALFVIGAIYIISSVIVTAVWVAVLSALLGIVAVAVSIWAIYVEKQYRHYQMCREAPPLPVWGRFPSIIIDEHVIGSIRLTSDSEYLTGGEHADGVMKFSLQLTAHDRERAKKYWQKYTLSTRENIPFHAGFAVLQGTRRIRPENWGSQQVNPVRFMGQVLAQSYLLGTTSTHARQWTHHYKYNVLSDTQCTAGLPVQIIPTLLSEGDEWALELDVQVNPKIDSASLSFPRVEELVLEAPDFLGVESQAPSAEVSEQGPCKITWQRAGLAKQGKQAVANKTFYVRFTNSKMIKPDKEVFGHVRLSFEGAISGLENVRLFSPLGRQRSQDEITFVRHTIVEIDFRFHLSGLNVRKLYAKSESIEQLTVIPGNEMISRLVEALNDKEIYVQRVIENPPQMNWANAHIMNRLWVIAGRRYKKATPIDFRIVAIGQEHYDDIDKPYDGTTQFEITTQGTIIKESMRADIECLYQNIVDAIQSAPALKIDNIVQGDLFVDVWGTLSGTITNTGEVVAREVNISATGLKVEQSKTIRQLLPGEQERFRLDVYADKKGDVPITITAVCKDQFGQLPPYKKRCHIQVKEAPTTPTMSTTNIHGSVTGPLHTGTGHIQSGDKNVRG
jgi:hypothetical protein